MKTFTKTFLHILSIFSLAGILIFSTGCEQLLNEALQKDIVVQETLFEDDTATAEEEIVQVGANNIQLGSTAKIAKASAFHILPFTPSSAADAALLAWVISEGGGKIRGEINNLDAASVVFKVYVGTSSDINDATLIGSVNVAGNQTKSFIFNGTELESYFDNLHDNGWNAVNIFLSAEESSSPHLIVNTLEFVFNPAGYMSRVIAASSEYSGYADSIGDISDYSLSGEIRNKGTSELKILIRIKPSTATSLFSSFEVAITLSAGQTFNLADWASMFTTAQLAAINSQFAGALEYLATGNVLAELFLMSNNPLNAEIVSIAMSGTVSVGL
ncbi:hypothetical protein KAR48_16940 [bacterium]|nr:hypothetical protein [bacterium]